MKFFQNPKAFDVLINSLEDKSFSVELKATVASGIIKFPQLQRFKDYLPRIEKIISQETEIFKTLKRYPNWQLYSDYKYLIERLQKLTKLIKGEIEEKWQRAKEQ